MEGIYTELDRIHRRVFDIDLKLLIVDRLLLESLRFCLASATKPGGTNELDLARRLRQAVVSELTDPAGIDDGPGEQVRVRLSEIAGPIFDKLERALKNLDVSVECLHCRKIFIVQRPAKRELVTLTCTHCGGDFFYQEPEAL
jgi:hypothetical protein